MVHALAAAVALAVSQAPTVHSVKSDWVIDGAITGGGVAAYLTSELVLKPYLAPSTCRWCDRTTDGSDALNPADAAARSALAWSRGRQPVADALSNVDVYLLVPAAAYGLDAYLAASNGALGLWWEDALIITEAGVFAALLNQAVKFMVGRERPFVHVLPDAEKPLTHLPADNNLSFFSGHSSTAFAVLAAALAVAELRGYEGRWILWAVGLPLALAAPYLRMAADKHYLTDVLTGALVGGAIGYLAPMLLHPRTTAPAGQQPLGLRVSAAPAGFGIALTFP